MADLAKGVLRRKIPALRQALRGRFSGHHALIVGEILAKPGCLDEAIGRLSSEIDRVIAPFARQRDLVATMPGIDKRTAEGIVAEIGVDMSVFGDAAHLASRAGRCPGQYESAGKSTSGKTRKGNKWLRTYLHDAASTTIRRKNTYHAAQYARIKGRSGHAKALGAVQHSILVALFHIPGRDEPFHELGPDYFIQRHNPDRRARRLIDELTALGCNVTAEAPAA